MTLRYVFNNGPGGHTVSFSPDRRFLAICSGSSCRVSVFDLGGVCDDGMQPVVVLPGNACRASFRPVVATSDGCCELAVSTLSGQVHLWSPQTKECSRPLNIAIECPGDVTWSPNGRFLAVEDILNTDIHVQSIPELQPVATNHTVAILRGHTGSITATAFSADNKLLASVSMDGTIRLWHMPDGAVMNVLHMPDGIEENVWYMPDGAVGHQLQVAIDRYASCAAFPPVHNTRLLAVGTSDYSVQLWHVETGLLVHELRGHEDDVTAIAFAPGGGEFASGSDDATVRRWRVSRDGSGGGDVYRCVDVLSLDTKVRSLAYSPDGRFLAVSAGETPLRLYTVCRWSDRNHRWFGPELRAAVFLLMCIRERFEVNGCTSLILPRLPMELWLEVFAALAALMNQMEL